MGENMVRTQIYLPRKTYDALQRRAETEGLTLASQIREALDEYLKRVEADEEGVILQPDDPIFKLIGAFDSGVEDLDINHDYYLYGMPKRALPAERRLKEARQPTKRPAKTRTPRRRSRSRKSAR